MVLLSRRSSVWYEGITETSDSRPCDRDILMDEQSGRFMSQGRMTQQFEQEREQS